MKTVTKLWIGIAVLIVLSPLGLILPAHFKAGSAWGEWGAMTRYGGTNVSYVLSAIGGVLVIVAVVFVIGKMLSRKDG